MTNDIKRKLIKAKAKKSCCRILLLALILTYLCLLLGLQISQRQQLRQTLTFFDRLELTIANSIFPTPFNESNAVATTSSTTVASTVLIPRVKEYQIRRSPSGNHSLLWWEESAALPQWTKDYFAWHREQRALLNRSNWRNFKYITMQCVKSDKHCGGTADRLKPVPLMVLVGYLSQRIFLIHWETPKPLEEFLIPPTGGLDWRMPDYLVPEIGSSKFPICNDGRLLNAIQFRQQEVAWNLRYQTYHWGTQFFNKYKPDGSPSFDQVYHDMWQVIFTPSPPIARQIKDWMEYLQLVPGRYVSVHVRAQYARVQRARLSTIMLTRNALKCASMLYPGGPMFVASDDPISTHEAKVYGAWKKTSIVARNDSTPPLHLERANRSEMRHPSEYYDTFVDLYLMASAQCVAYNKGGFGHWASLISYNVSCSMRHQFNDNFTDCKWTRPPPGATKNFSMVHGQSFIH